MSTFTDDLVVSRIVSYLDSDDSEWWRDRIADGDLKRDAGVNKQRWLSCASGAHDAVLRGAESAFADLALNDGDTGVTGTHHISRRDLRDASTDCTDTEGYVRLFTLTMLWGNGTRTRWGPGNLKTALSDARLPDTLESTREAIRALDLREAYRTFYQTQKIGVGEAFFSKWFWACSLADPRAELAPLILDSRVQDSLTRLAFSLREAAGSNRAEDCYVAYVNAAHRWAQALSTDGVSMTAEHVEWLIFCKGPQSLNDWLRRGGGARA
jgi:hypothetical protein